MQGACGVCLDPGAFSRFLSLSLHQGKYFKLDGGSDLQVLGWERNGHLPTATQRQEELMAADVGAESLWTLLSAPDPDNRVFRLSCTLVAIEVLTLLVVCGRCAHHVSGGVCRFHPSSPTRLEVCSN